MIYRKNSYALVFFHTLIHIILEMSENYLDWQLRNRRCLQTSYKSYAQENRYHAEHRKSNFMTFMSLSLKQNNGCHHGYFISNLLPYRWTQRNINTAVFTDISLQSR